MKIDNIVFNFTFYGRCYIFLTNQNKKNGNLPQHLWVTTILQGSCKLILVHEFVSFLLDTRNSHLNLYYSMKWHLKSKMLKLLGCNSTIYTRQPDEKKIIYTKLLIICSIRIQIIGGICNSQYLPSTTTDGTLKSQHCRGGERSLSSCPNIIVNHRKKITSMYGISFRGLSAK